MICPKRMHGIAAVLSLLAYMLHKIFFSDAIPIASLHSCFVTKHWVVSNLSPDSELFRLL